MDGRELRERRIERGLTQDQVANAIETTWMRQSGHRWDQDEDLDRITQSMVSQMETGERPIPREERELNGRKLPSIHDSLVELFSQSDAALHQRIAASERGPYKPR